METNQNPSSLVIPSHLSAERAVQNWLQQNRLDLVKDAAGLEWRIHVDMREVPDNVDHRRSMVELTVRIDASANARQLVATQTLDAVRDERLVALLGDDSIPFTRKPEYFEGKSMDDARRWLGDRMLQIGEEMRSSAFHDVKRNLVGRWIDAKGEFGHSHLTQQIQDVAANPLTQKQKLK